ncbi:helix-turn-helix domain-containing protein [Halobacterium salinarum]|uniref:ArsR family transcription regulator n=1 Tax=Halobacterium salinarum (strain ATCC 29341 / DSM 671 / R1) TaxID=478009 RepID=B0RA45_HALS3|nr:helix-turn-helix domain-containing protein [Halobacterium salinarum]MCF2164514.1 helix-turn-helix domain-containing protein [Halobacterium salinarum]MCF2168793.1 helix-turn-helix domain-containing protein [Halobacterium salinarum]CAP15659.1 ArsR family transcription regulator [Halobacterium salinarum R1]
MYTEAELRALEALHGESTVSALAEELDRSRSYVSELVDRMESKGLVHTSREGKQKQIHRSDARAIELFDSFVQQYTHIPFPELLGGATLRILYYLQSPATATQLAERADFHRSTVHRSLSPLENRGMIYKSDGKYVLNDDFEELSTVAREFAHLRHRHRVEGDAESFTLLWESLDEFLVQTRAEIEEDAFHLTGPELFQAYDLPLMARQRWYYLHSESIDEVSPAELCCHMLVIDAGTRSQSYCLLLISETVIDRDELLEAGKKYDVAERVSNLLEYLDTEGESRSERLPRWEEFRELADEYGVEV